MQFEDAGEDGTFAEEGKMEVNEEVDGKKNWISERKTCSTNCDTSNECPEMWRRVCKKETWQQEPQDTEQRRNDLLPEHQKMQKTQKLQSSHDKKEQMGWRK